MKQSKFQVIETELGIFRFSVYTVVSSDKVKVCKYINAIPSGIGYTFSPEDMSGYGCIFRLGNYSPRIWIPRRPRTNQEYATLAHEALHATMCMIRWAGIPVSLDSEEVLTHCTSWIIENTLNKCK